MKDMEVNGFKVVGVGGIGTSLIGDLARYLQYSYEADDMFDFWLIDGDSFEKKNLVRQGCKPEHVGRNKAEVAAEQLAVEFTDIDVTAKGSYLTDDNIAKMIVEGDVVFMGVDNHKTRKMVSDHCSTLKNVVLISGGNEMTDGNVQVHIRKNGEDLTAPITAFHPEIANPADKAPWELGCVDLVAENPQLLFMNRQIASSMLNAFFRLEQGFEGMYGEVYVDILDNTMLSLERKPAATHAAQNE